MGELPGRNVAKTGKGKNWKSRGRGKEKKYGGRIYTPASGFHINFPWI